MNYLCVMTVTKQMFMSKEEYIKDMEKTDDKQPLYMDILLEQPLYVNKLLEQQRKEPIRIDLPFLPSKEREVISCKECYLLLHDTHIEYKIVAEYITISEDGIREELACNYRCTRLKRNISDVDMYMDKRQESSRWGISIEFQGVEKGMSWYFEFPKEALKVYEMLKNYYSS